MTDSALKTFVEGDKIKATDTNSNNQYIIGLIEGVETTLQAYLEQQISQLSGNFFKAGYILAIPFTTVPTGFLACDGSSVLIEDYEDLYDAIGTTYGAVDEYHFNLPDFQGMFLRGVGGNAATLGTVQYSGLPNITGALRPIPTNNFSVSGAFYKMSGTSGSTREDGGSADYRVGFDASLMDYTRIINGESQTVKIYQDGLTEVRPDNMSVKYVIKY